MEQRTGRRAKRSFVRRQEARRAEKGGVAVEAAQGNVSQGPWRQSPRAREGDDRNHLRGRGRLYVASASRTSPPHQKTAPAGEHGRVQGSTASYRSRSPYPVSPHLDDVRCSLGGDVTDAAATGRIPSLPSSASSAVGSSRTRLSNDTRGLNGERALHQALSQSVSCAYQRSHPIPRV